MSDSGYREPAPPPPPFAFSEDEVRVFGSLARSTQTVGLATVIAGGLPLVLAVVGLVAVGAALAMSSVPWASLIVRFIAYGWLGLLPYVVLLIGALMLISLGSNLRRAGDAFQRIVTRSGEETTLVVDGVRELTHVYAFWRLQMIYAVAVVGIAAFWFLRWLRPM